MTPLARILSRRMSSSRATYNCSDLSRLFMFRNPLFGASSCSVQVLYAGNEPNYDGGWHSTVEEEGGREFLCRRRDSRDCGLLSRLCLVQLISFNRVVSIGNGQGDHRCRGSRGWRRSKNRCKPVVNVQQLVAAISQFASLGIRIRLVTGRRISKLALSLLSWRKRVTT